MDPIKNHRGAPKGNKNARKHGFYSHTFSRKVVDLWQVG
jgi:uncharacterized protein YjcR